MSALAEQVTDFERRLGRPLIGPARFSELIGRALEEGEGFAAGKVGDSERRILQYPIVLERVSDRKVLWAYEKLLAHQQLGGAGLFPPEAEFYRHWNRIDRVTASRAGTGRHNYRGKKKTEVLFTNF